MIRRVTSMSLTCQPTEFASMTAMEDSWIGGTVPVAPTDYLILWAASPSIYRATSTWLNGSSVVCESFVYPRTQPPEHLYVLFARYVTIVTVYCPGHNIALWSLGDTDLNSVTISVMTVCNS